MDNKQQFVADLNTKLTGLYNGKLGVVGFIDWLRKTDVKKDLQDQIESVIDQMLSLNKADVVWRINTILSDFGMDLFGEFDPHKTVEMPQMFENDALEWNSNSGVNFTGRASQAFTQAVKELQRPDFPEKKEPPKQTERLSKGLCNLSEQITKLGNLVTNPNSKFDKRFDWAVIEFKRFLQDQANELPVGLVQELSSKDWTTYGDQNSYVNDLWRSYNKFTGSQQSESFKSHDNSYGNR